MLLLKDLGLVTNNLRRVMRAIATEAIATVRWVAVVQAGELNKTIRGKDLCSATGRHCTVCTCAHNVETFRQVG